MQFNDVDLWKALVLYGLNQATYKIGLAKTLLDLSNKGKTKVLWPELSEAFFEQYRQRLLVDEPLPQQGNSSRRTKMEQIVAATQTGLKREVAIEEVGATAFGDVIHRFHTLIGVDDTQGLFYRYEFGKHIELTDALHRVQQSKEAELQAELNARWSLLEGAFSIGADNYVLANEIRSIYIAHGTKRRDLTDTVPFLQGYQGNTCFYCCEPVAPNDLHVDHVLPRQVVRHDEIWNLAIAHKLCNLQKSDNLVGEHFIRKLIARNENIMGSNHPWKKKIALALGDTPVKRVATIQRHYDDVRVVLGPRYWGNEEHYNPASDPFFLRLITLINNP